MQTHRVSLSFIRTGISAIFIVSKFIIVYMSCARGMCRSVYISLSSYFLIFFFPMRRKYTQKKSLNERTNERTSITDTKMGHMYSVNIITDYI